FHCRRVRVCCGHDPYNLQTFGFGNGFFAKLSFKSSQKMVHVVVADTSHNIKSLESKAKHTKQVLILKL
ncbi:hypothetical protein LSH36_121g13004, partial [Paralvinella palmiformis]